MFSKNLCLLFARQDGQDGKKPEGNHKTKVTKIPKTKRQECGMNETSDLLFLQIKLQNYPQNLP